MYWQRRLPHWVPSHAVVFVTWRLAGSLPFAEPRLLQRNPDPGKAFALRDRQVDLDRSGPQWLGDSRIAAMVQEALLYGATNRYDLFAWVIMPNHVHAVLKPHEELAEIMRWLKTATGV